MPTWTEEDLEIPRGGTWPAHAWILVDDDGEPLLQPPDDPVVVAKIRRTVTDPEVLFVFSGSVVMLTLPGQFNDQPVAAVQLAAIPYTVTSLWTFDEGRWDMLLGYEPIKGGAVTAPLLVSR